MQQKLKIALVDDDEVMHDIMCDLYSDSDLVEIKYCYTDSRKFIQEAPSLDFDLCFLDISIPGMDGLTLAQLLKNKPFIFITGSEDKLRNALSLSPIDVVTKPFNKERLDHAIDKAFKLIGNKIENALFNIAESSRKVKIHLPDIIFADTDEVDPRHKLVVLKDGTRYTIMDCSLEQLTNYAPQLMQVNRRQLVALENMGEMQYDMVALKDAKQFGVPAEVTLSRKYKEEVKKKIFFK